MGNKIDGTAISKEVRQEIAIEVKDIVEKGQRVPCLVVFMVGDDPRSATYVRNKQKACEEVGIKCILEKLPATISQDTLLTKIEGYNQDDSVDGIIVQLPLPQGFDEKKVTETVCSKKDVDGLTSANLIKLYNNEPCLVAATPSGIMKLLEKIDVEVSGKQVVIVGRGKLVGKPLALLMTNHNATVTLCHSHSQNLKEITQTADILVVAIGKSEFIDDSFIK